MSAQKKFLFTYRHRPTNHTPNERVIIEVPVTDPDDMDAAQAEATKRFKDMFIDGMPPLWKCSDADGVTFL